MNKLILTIGALFLLSACGTSPEPDYFSLTETTGNVLPDLHAVIKIQRPILAGYLDRPDFVRQSGTDQLLIDNTTHWGEPLDKMITRIVAADLQQRLPASIVLTDENVGIADIRFVVEMNVNRFNLVDDDKAVLNGELILKDKTRPADLRHVPFELDARADAAPQSVVNALTQLIGSLSDFIAQQVSKFPAANKLSGN